MLFSTVLRYLAESNEQCSGESPCKTCASVMSARVWKLDCMRTNIYKELDIFHPGFIDPAALTMRPPAQGLFEILYCRLIEQWKSGSVSGSDRCVVRVSHATHDRGPMLLPALLYKQNTDDSAGNCGADKETLGRKAVFLDESKEQISAKFLSHVKTTISSADNSDLNDLVGPTLRLASAMIRDRNVSHDIRKHPT